MKQLVPDKKIIINGAKRSIYVDIKTKECYYRTGVKKSDIKYHKIEKEQLGGNFIEHIKSYCNYAVSKLTNGLYKQIVDKIEYYNRYGNFQNSYEIIEGRNLERRLSTALEQCVQPSTSLVIDVNNYVNKNSNESVLSKRRISSSVRVPQTPSRRP